MGYRFAPDRSGQLRERLREPAWSRRDADEGQARAPRRRASRRTIEAWRIEYNRDRPHGSLGDQSPQDFLRTLVTQQPAPEMRRF